MGLDMEPVNEKDIRIEAREDTVYFYGDITIENFGELLTPFLNKLHRKVLQDDLKTINLDITNLNYLNSNGISEIVEWLLLVDEMEEDQQYHIHIVYNSNILWQDSTVSTFVQFNPRIVTKELV